MKKILLIEDDTVMRENTAELLELANFDIKTAENGKEGIVLAKSYCPDLIICDIMMPQIDGYGVLNVLSRDPLTAAIPFVFLTAKTEIGEVRRGMELGADDYLTKPFEETELLNAIDMRFKKLDLFKNKFSEKPDGLDQFLDSARGLEELEELSKEKRLIDYKKKQVVYNEGDSPQYLYYISEGKVKTYKAHDDGKEYITSVSKKGDFFGLTPLFENRPYTDSAIVLENSKIRKIPKEDFLALIYKNRDVAAQFMKILSRNVALNEQQLLSLAYNSVRKRTAEALINLEIQYSKDDRFETEISVTREDLAGMAGTTTETVIRCLRDFRDSKYIEVRGRKTIILNLDGLKKIQH